MASITTIQIKKETKALLDAMRVSKRDSYNDIIENLIEDSLDLNEAAKRDIEEAMEDIKLGRIHTLDEVKTHLGL